MAIDEIVINDGKKTGAGQSLACMGANIARPARYQNNVIAHIGLPA
jgi:hypothetical protein